MISLEQQERRAAENLNRLVDLLETRDDQWKDHPAKAWEARRLGEERKPRAPTGDWTDRAACRNQAGDWVIVPTHYGPKNQRRLKAAELAVCQACPVKAKCKEAGEKEVVGIWGGLLPIERKEMK